MKIVVVSDSHDNLPNLKKAVGWAKEKKAGLILHCGDVSQPRVLEEALDGFPGEFAVALGNADKGFSWNEKRESNGVWKERVFEDWGEKKAGGKRIAFTHFPSRAKKLVETGGFDLVFYGHTHKPWERNIKGCLLVNPGNIAGLTYRPTFAVYDTEKEDLKLKIVERLKD